MVHKVPSGGDAHQAGSQAHKLNTDFAFLDPHLRWGLQSVYTVDGLLSPQMLPMQGQWDSRGAHGGRVMKSHRLKRKGNSTSAGLVLEITRQHFHLLP